MDALHMIASKKHVTKYDYLPTSITSGLWYHKTKPINLTLVVGAFGVKYVGRENAEQLKNTLESMYKMTINWEGKLYNGITLKWKHIKHMVELSMPGFVEVEMYELEHSKHSQPQDSPYLLNEPTYGANSQLTSPPDTTPTLLPEKAPYCKE